MSTTSQQHEDDDEVPAFLSGGGISGELIRSIDWSKTPVGPVSSWPGSLKNTVGTILHSRHPMFLWWGPELIQFYNDAYLPSFGKGKHPAAMGQPGRECWPEIWPIIWPQIEDVMKRGKSSWNEDHLVPIFRNGRIEEVYWTYGYSPVFDESGGIAGTLVVCTETTARVVGARRLWTMGALVEKMALATEPADVLRQAGEVFQSAASDIPFALLYTFEQPGHAQLVASIGPTDALPTSFEPTFAGAAQLIALPEGPWPAQVTEAFRVPIRASSTSAANGFLVFGLNPRLPFDDAYRAHLGELAEGISRTQERLAAAHVRAAAERERNNLLSKAPVATALLTGPEHVFQLANPLYCQMVGRHDLVGKTYAQAFPELADPALLSILNRVYATGEPFVTNEYPLALDRRGDGTLEDCIFKFNLEPLRDPAGSVYGMMAVAVDVTAQVNARRVLEQAQVEREKLLAELSAANRAKDEFLAMLGHELRNPLSPIVTALSLMKLRGDGRTSREQSIIERQVTHLVRLVDDLLDVAKITRGKIELQKERIEIAGVLAKAVEISSYLLEQRNHRLTIDVAASGLALDGDPVRLAQVVANLLTNAARYTDPGGEIQLMACRDSHDIMITVRDTGVGIAAEMLPRIFDLFVQGQRSADRAEGGLGIGLTLVKNLVALHGGSVVANSNGVGRGSEFVVRLPASTSANSMVGIGPSPVPVLGASSRRRVLVVDDNIDAANLLCEVLRSVGHDVMAVHDPLVALDAIERFTPEVAVLDIGLPVMDGYELAAKMRLSPKAATCRLLALTGYGQEHDRERSEQAGFAGHLVKPVDVEALLRAIDSSPEAQTTSMPDVR